MGVVSIIVGITSLNVESSLKKIAYYMMFWLAGLDILDFLFFIEARTKNKVRITMICIVLLCIFEIVYVNSCVKANKYLLKSEEVIFAFVISIMMIYVSNVICHRTRILSIIGRGSLEIYLLHIFILALIRALATKISFSLIAYVLISCVTGLGVPLIVYYAETKSNFIKYIFHPKYFLRNYIIIEEADN